MNASLDTLFVQAFIAFARVAGCFLVLPGFASARVPQHVRVLFVLTLTLALMPILPKASTNYAMPSEAALVRILFFETVIGAVIGLSVRYYISAVSFIISAASSVIGYSSLIGPSIVENDMEPALGSMMTFAALLAIFALDFHHDVIRALIATYAVIPVGSPISFSAIASNLTSTLTDCFLIVFRLGSPFLAYALLANLFVALLNKLTPNLPLYFVATPAVLAGGLIVAYFILPAFLSFVGQGLQTLSVFQ